MVTQVQKAEKYIVVKVVKISDGSAQSIERVWVETRRFHRRLTQTICSQWPLPKRLCLAVGHNSRKSKFVGRFTRLQLTS